MMCLDYSKKMTDSFKKNRPQIITCYKSMSISVKNELCGMFKLKQYTVGINKSNRIYKRIFKNEVRKNGTIRLNKGLHVFITRRAAQSVSNIVVPVQCNLNDLVGVGKFMGYKSAVFTKVFLSKKNYQRALNLEL